MILTRLPVIDVAVRLSQWTEEILRTTGLTKLEDGQFFCVDKAFFTARKHLPKGTAILLSKDDNIPDFDSQEQIDKMNMPAAAKLGDIILSKSANPAVVKSKIWINGVHIQMMKELLSEGLTLELLDENGQVIREISQ